MKTLHESPMHVIPSNRLYNNNIMTLFGYLVVYTILIILVNSAEHLGS